MEDLFRDGASRSKYPVKLIYLLSAAPLTFPAQVMFVVPKRIFKRAHDRNLIRRRMREVYRLNKQELYQKLGNVRVLIALVYYSKKSEPYDQLKRAISSLLKEISEQPVP